MRTVGFPAPFASAQQPLNGGLAVTSVTTNSPGTILRWTFSGAITWDGITTPTELEAFTSDVMWDTPVSVQAVGANWIEVEYNADVPAGNDWRVLAQPAGITPALVIPQTGQAAT